MLARTRESVTIIASRFASSIPVSCNCSYYRVDMPKKTKTSSNNKCIHGPTNTFTITSPVGELELVSCPKGIHSLEIMIDNDDHFSPDTSIEIELLKQLYQDNGYTYKPVNIAVTWLINYFHGNNLSSLKKTMPPICHLLGVDENSPFRSRVWSSLTDEVSFGETVTYGGLAELIGGTRGHSQAVGSAMRNNPVGIITPCHRVLPSTGKVGNYSGGKKNSVKSWLLRHEGVEIE